MNNISLNLAMSVENKAEVTNSWILLYLNSMIVTAASCAALIPYPSLKAQNRFCLLFTPLPVAEGDDPLECVREVHQATPYNFLLAAEVVMAYWITWLGGSFPVFINNWLQFGICQATTLLSNLPGPQKSTKIFGGDVIQDIVGWSPIRNRIGVGICLFGYNGRLRANVIADGAAFPNAEDVSLFIEEFEKEIRLLGAQCSLSDEDCFDEPQLHAMPFNSHLLTE